MQYAGALWPSGVASKDALQLIEVREAVLNDCCLVGEVDILATEHAPKGGSAPDERRSVEPNFLRWLVREDEVEISGTVTKCYRIEPNIDDASLDEWATHIRRHYRRDKELQEALKGYTADLSSYLADFVIPDAPEIRSGDFAEIVICDLLEFMENYAVSRYKHLDRADKNCSEHGSDVIAYRVTDSQHPRSSDELLVVEVKSRASTTNLKQAIMDAGADSMRDKARLAMTLDYHRCRSERYGDSTNADAMARFLNRGEYPCREIYAIGAIAGLKNAGRHLGGAESKTLGLSEDMPVYIVHKPKLMEMIHDLYRRCCL